MVTTTISSQVNHGIILGSGNYGSNLTVSKTGGINGSAYGVYADFGQDRLLNSGTIRATEVAVDLPYAGTVNNSGIIHGGTFGVALHTNGKLVNSGTISAASQYAVGLSEGGSVNNSGLITSENAGVVLDTSVQLTNSGDIYGEAFGVVTRLFDNLVNTGTISGGSHYAVGLWEGSSLTNHGHIGASNLGVLIEDGALTNTGSIAGQAIGAYLYGGFVTNSGSIHGGMIGIDLIGANSQSDYVTNTIKGVVSGGEFGVVLRNQTDSPVELNNAGKITGNLAGAYLYGGVLTNSGMIQGSVGVYLKSGELVDTGTISGTSFAVELNGAGTLSLASKAVLEGAVTDLAGDGTIVLGSGGQDRLSGIGSSVTGFSNIVFGYDEAWTVQGNIAGLASGQTITNFSLFDLGQYNTLALSGFAAAFGYFGPGNDLFTLSNGAATLVLTLANSTGFRNGAIAVFTEDGNTYLVTNDFGSADSFKPKAGSISQINGLKTHSVTPGEGDDAVVVTIGTKGTIDTSTAPAVVGPVGSDTSSLINDGLIESSYGIAVAGIHAMTNVGTIIGDVSADILNNSGVLLGNLVGSSLTNTGTIVGGVAEYCVSNGGLITSGNSRAAVTIAGLADGEAGPAYFSSRSNVIGTTYGIDLEYSRASFRNFGHVYGNITGIVMDSYSAISNYGSVGGAEGIHLEDGGTILNAGTISGISYAIDDSDSASRGLIPPLHVIVEPGAVFDGTVYDATGYGALTLVGSTAGSLDMGISFIGFDAISFIGGSTWRLEGSVSELAGGQAIGGFSVGDMLVLDGFSANADTYVSGIGLELFHGSRTATLDIAGDFSTGNFSVTKFFGNTTITETSMVAALVGNVGSTL